MSDHLRLGFIGKGKMATALARGFVGSGLVRVEQLIGSDPSAEARNQFREVTGGRVTEANDEVMAEASTILLTVKPDQVPTVLAALAPRFQAEHLLVSVAAGVSLGRLEAALPSGSRVVRTMPNTPALVGCSATAYAVGSGVRAEDAALVQRLFASVGLAVEVKEALLDAVTGLSGSGPAYVYRIIEALSDGGVSVGLPRDVATRLAAQTVMGSARMVLETGAHPAALKDMVTSPGGTTIEGLHELEKGGVSAALMSAVRKATEKARQLGS